MKRFDRKFGDDFLGELPQSPGVYLFKDEQGTVVYVGKSKNLRKRLSAYRNPSRRKADRKVRRIVRDAHSIEIRLQTSEADALLVENQLIRELRPRHNVEGAFDFLYPSIGIGRDADRLVLCCTTEPEAFASLDLIWHGTFRPRTRAMEAFDALQTLLCQIGHPDPRGSLPEAPRRKGSRVLAIRRIPPEIQPQLDRFLDGLDDALLAALSFQLLESREARRSAADIQTALHTLLDFYEADVTALKRAREETGYAHAFVPRSERDSLFIRARAKSLVGDAPG